MRFAWFLAAAGLAILAAAPSHTAQYPVAGLTATGRSFTLSRPRLEGLHPEHLLPAPRPGRRRHRPLPRRPANLLEQRPVGQPQRDHRHGQLQRPLERLHDAVLEHRHPTAFQSVLDQALAKVRAESDISDNLHWDKIAVSSFSAGYGAVREILKSATYRNEINSLLTADSLYATTAGDGTPLDSQMVDYKTFALAAKNGQKTFLFSHSQVPTYTYENTGGNRRRADAIPGHLPDRLLGQRPRHAQLLPPRPNRQLPPLGCSRRHGRRPLGAPPLHRRLPRRTPPRETIPGDFNNSGTVDAADYVLWRKKNGGTALPNDGGITPGVTNAADYTYWRSRYGAVSGPSHQHRRAASPIQQLFPNPPPGC